MERENLWKKYWIEFWRDPIVVRDFFISTTFLMRIFSLLWLAVVLFALTAAVLPAQQKSWALWLPPEDARLAHDTAAVVTYGSFLVVVMVQAAMMKRARWIGGFGVLLAAMLLSFSLVGAFNYYSHANERTSGATVTSGVNAVSAVAEAEAALDTHDLETKAALDKIDAESARALALFDDQISKVPANYPTGMSRLVRQRTAAAETAAKARSDTMAFATAKRADLVKALDSARATNVDTIATKSDTRPVDGFVSRLTGFERRDVSNFMDLSRSAVFELLIIIGAPLFTLGLLAALDMRVAPAKIVIVETPIPPKPKPRPRPNQVRVRPATDEELAAWDAEELGIINDPKPQADPPEPPEPPQPPEPPVGDPPTE